MTGTAPDGPATPPAATPRPVVNAWQRRAEDLARWSMARVVNRTDRCGGYWLGKNKDTGADEVNQTWRPKDATAGFVDLRYLARHFRAAEVGHIFGAPSLGADSFGKWLGIDLDNHDDDGHPGDPEANLRFALAIYADLVRIGFRPLLYESNGRGGFHLIVLFSAPVAGAVLFRFGRWLVRNHAEFGFAKAPEVFPKQVAITPGAPWGNWLRLIGKHPKRDYWSRVWSGSEWLDGEAAVDFVLAMPGDDAGMVPHEAVAHEPDGRREEERSAGRESGLWEVLPGTDFNRRARWPEIIEPAGWKHDHTREDGVELWTRPGKVAGTSATIGHCKTADGVPRMYVWTDGGDPLEQNGSYDPFKAHAAMRHGGDFSAAYRSLVEQGYGVRKACPAPPHKPTLPQPHAPCQFAVGDVVLVPDRPHRTPGGKITVNVKVTRGGKTRDTISVTGALSNRAVAAKAVAVHLAEQDKNKAHAALTSLLAWAADELDRQSAAGPEGMTVRQIVGQIAPRDLGISYRTDRGVFSTARGCEITRHDFLAYVPSSLLEAAAEAADAPRDDRGRVRDGPLLGLVKSALEVVWSDLMHTLKPPTETPGETVAGRSFRAAVERVWHATRTFAVDKTDGKDSATRVSLASSVRAQSASFRNGQKLPTKRESWQQVKDAFEAWWRPHTRKSDGQVVILLAMRYTLGDQVYVKIPEAFDQKSFNRIGVSYGVFEEDPPVIKRDSDGTHICVLTMATSVRILADAPEPEPDEDGGDGETPTAAEATPPLTDRRNDCVSGGGFFSRQ